MLAAPDSALVARVDHVMVRTQSPIEVADQLATVLDLPVLQAARSFPGAFTNTAVAAGDTPIELIAFGDPAVSPRPVSAESARLWGVAFEATRPLDELAGALRRRNLSTAGVQAFELVDDEGRWQPMWSTLNLALLEDGRRVRAAYRAQRLFAPMMRRMTRKQVVAASAGRPVRAMDERRLDTWNDVLGHGWTFFCEYAPEFTTAEKVRAQAAEASRVEPGHGVGVVGIAEVVIGVRDLAGARRRWQRLLDPHAEQAPSVWRLGDGPAVRLVQHEKSSLIRLVLEVPSLTQARAALRARDALAGEEGDRLAVASKQIGGLDVQLVGRHDTGR